MIKDNIKKQNEELRLETIDRLLQTGAPLQDICDIITKMFIADKEDFDKEYIDSLVFGRHGELIYTNPNPKKTMQSRVEDWLTSNTSNNPCYSVVTVLLHDCYSDLGLKTPNDKVACRMAFKRLVEKGVLEQVRNRSGEYRHISYANEEIIDFMRADTTPFSVRFPLGIHELVSIHPGNSIVVAGESNAGKSAFCLNVAKANCHDNFVNYMSSEMQDGAELKIRLQKFGENLENWRKIKFTFRTDDFPHHIMPDAVNIIDYLDEGTDAEAYKMPMRIRQIADKLKKGIVVIALQKDPAKGLGFGGSGTMNRSRLYLTMTRGGVLKIEKAKIWRNDGINPNGMFCSFKLVGGAKFVKDSEWKQ